MLADWATSVKGICVNPLPSTRRRAKLLPSAYRGG